MTAAAAAKMANVSECSINGALRVNYSASYTFGLLPTVYDMLVSQSFRIIQGITFNNSLKPGYASTEK